MIPILISDKFDLLRLKDSNGKAMFDSEGRALYVPDANPTIPEHNGLGEMGDAISCIVKSTINAPDELTMTYPVTGSLYKDKDIKERCVIMAKPDQTRGPQPFRIYRITKDIKERITIYARHLAYDGLSGIPVAPFTASDIQGAMAGLKANAMVNCPFKLITTRTTAAKFSVKVPTDIWSLLGGQQGSLLDVYGGEYSFDGYNITLENRIGQDNGVKVRYGVNMVDLEQDTNIANCYTGVVAYWRNEEDEIHSPVMYAGGTYGYVRILPVDMSTRWESKPTVEQLKAAAVKYIKDNQIGVPKVSWKVKMVDLADTEEYKDLALLERVSLGDTVGVEFEALGVDATSRVRSIEWDVLKERYQTITLGSVKANIASTIAGQSRAIANIPSLQQVTSVATGVFQGQMSNYKSSGDIGEGFGDCSAAFDGQVLKGWQESTGIPLWQIGAAVSYFGDSYIASGDIKLYAIGEGIDSSRPALWVGSDGGAWGIVVRDPYDGYNGSVSMIFHPDTGILFTIHDDDGNQTLSMQQNGLLRAKEIRCDRLVVNGHEITG